MISYLTSLFTLPFDTPLSTTPDENLPLYITELFQKYHFDPTRLPTLNLGTSEGCNGRIVFLHPNRMKAPIMHLKDDFGHKGLALLVIRKNDGFASVFRIFQENTPDGLFWKSNVYGTLQQNLQQRHADEAHEGDPFMDCPQCPFTDTRPISEETLIKLFTGTDEDFQLGSLPDFRLFGESSGSN